MFRTKEDMEMYEVSYEFHEWYTSNSIFSSINTFVYIRTELRMKKNDVVYARTYKEASIDFDAFY